MSVQPWVRVLLLTPTSAMISNPLSSSVGTLGFLYGDRVLLGGGVALRPERGQQHQEQDHAVVKPLNAIVWPSEYRDGGLSGWWWCGFRDSEKTDTEGCLYLCSDTNATWLTGLKRRLIRDRPRTSRIGHGSAEPHGSVPWLQPVATAQGY